MPNRPVQITTVAFDGVTAYPLATIQQLAPGLIGRAVPLPRVEDARQAILLRYRGDGYLLTTVSIHLDASGNLRFEIIEGRIAAVKLDGDIGPAGVQVLRFLNRLTEIAPITSTRLERYLLLAQDVPGITLHAVLEPSSDQPGALTLVAQVTRKAVAGLATVDNRAYKLTGPIEALAVADLNSVTEFGEKTEISLYHTFPDSQNFGQASTELFLGGSGLKLRVSGGAGTSDPTGPLGHVGYHGATTVFGTALSYPLIRARDQTLTTSLIFDGLESNVQTGSGDAVARQSFDSLRILRLGADYALSDLWLGGDYPGVNSVSARASHGLHWLGASESGTASDAPRHAERTDFTKVDLQLSRTQTILHPWDEANVAVMGLINAQWSNDILPPAEQFYLGGTSFTRGYYSGEVSGDKALTATLELQLNTANDLTLFGLTIDLATQYYLFYDWGETWQNQVTDASARISSAGGGARIAITKSTELDLEALARFNRYPAGSGAEVSALHGGAFYWRILARY